jgi:hypothetical protein
MAPFFAATDSPEGESDRAVDFVGHRVAGSLVQLPVICVHLDFDQLPDPHP